MNQVLRKAVCVDSVVWIIVLSLVLVSIYLAFMPQADAFAPEKTAIELITSNTPIIQANIDSLTERLKTVELNEKNINAKITVIEKQIDQTRLAYDKYHAEYLKLEEKSNIDWDALAGLKDAKILADNTGKKLEKLIEEKTVLENEKKENIKEIQEITDEIESETELLSQSKSEDSEKVKLVGVKISDTCIKLVRNNFTTTCPSYEDLIGIDSSNQYVSGYFVTESDGFLHRMEPNYKNSWKWYEHDEEIRVIVDPPSDMMKKIPMITIENNFGVYFRADDFRIDDEGVRKYNQHRYVSNCNDATLSTEIWVNALADTINMLQTGCRITEIQETFTEQLPKTEIDIRTSPNWKYNQWLSEVKDSCKIVCKQY